MPTKSKTRDTVRAVPAVKPPEHRSTLSELYNAVTDVRWANRRAADAARCKRCGIGDSLNMDRAVSRLLRVVLELPSDDLDLLIAPLDD